MGRLLARHIKIENIRMITLSDKFSSKNLNFQKQKNTQISSILIWICNNEVKPTIQSSHFNDYIVIQTCFYLLALKEKSVQDEVDFMTHLEGGSLNACDFAMLGKFERGLNELVNMC